MIFTTAQINAWVGEFLWPFMRVAMVFAVAPIFGGQLLPMKIRVMTALAITWLLIPVIPPVPAVDPLSAMGLIVALQQLLTGLIMGFVLQMVFAAFAIGGQTIAMSMGLGFASMVDPQNGVQGPVIGQYYTILASLLFLALDGHLVLIGVLADSFTFLPVAGSGVSRDVLWSVVAWAGRMFAGGVLIAIPAVSALLLTNITFGVITRSAPQLNIFGVGFPLTLTLGFIIMINALPSLLPQFNNLVSAAFALVQGMTPGPGS